ncbi:hypothetical protein KUH32_14885 [Thalassococcus sp. CAU 1522]|uniref:Uncharacterized protein n=1 Tax=Thalassococcus arenae TaxID=2851652 RepID=A0ABS6NB90_9RHOB|nr:hypothetical protein [Thalassococcus arenae]MBV2361048.1 hypothetical protein [Thalassococcus arenae]
MNHIVDLTDVTDYALDFVQMLGLVNRMAAHFEPGVSTKAALLAPSELSFGVARMFQSLADGNLPHDIHIFEDFGAAARFLDLDLVGRFGLFGEATRRSA